jgi:hypothetical protein
MAEAILGVAGLVEALRHQALDPLLRGRSHDRGHARVPTRLHFNIRRQAGGVDSERFT